MGTVYSMRGQEQMNDRAFTLDDKKSQEFFAQDKYTADKALARAEKFTNRSGIKARFIGKTSCGFVTNHIYNIHTKIVPMRKYESCIVVYDNNSSALCPYSRMETFLDNWEILER